MTSSSISHPQANTLPRVRSHGLMDQLIRRGVTLIAVLAFGIGGWSILTKISGAVIASGSLVADDNVKKVQHPTGGVVGAIYARDGDRVAAGAVLIRLDETMVRANWAIISKNIVEFRTRKARLETERDGRSEIAFPEDLLQSAKSDDEVAQVVDGERRILQLRLAARTGQKSVLAERSGQLQEEITGLEAQVEAKSDEIKLIERELQGVRDLWKKNLMQITKLTSIEREAARLRGERGLLLAQIAQAKGKISETQLQILQIDRDMAGEVGRELREIEAKIGEMIERKTAAEDQLKRIEIRAPLAGKIHQSTIHTVGGVIQPGEPLMLVVPDDENLTAEVRIAPQEIDQLWIGQPAALRFPAFNQRTTPEINGTVSRISADVSIDQRMGASFYLVRVGVPRSEVERLGDVKLISGMPVEVFMKTGDRTVFSWLMKPLVDQMARAFRER